MDSIFVDRTNEIRKEKKTLEHKLGVLIDIKGKQISFDGPAIKEFDAKRILEAIGFGFSAKTALLLLDESMIFRVIPIKQISRKANLEPVRSRLIGTHGKTKHAIEDIASCKLVIMGNAVGIIASAEEIEDATTAITNLIRGSKQANIYRFLERMNRERKIIRE